MQRDGGGVIRAALWHDKEVRSEAIQFRANAAFVSSLKRKNTEGQTDRDRDAERGHKGAKSLSEKIRFDYREPCSHNWLSL